MRSTSRQKVTKKNIHCKFFAQTGFLLEKVQLKLMPLIRSNYLHYIGIGDLGVIMITAHTSMDVRWNFPGVGEIMDFSMEWPKKFSRGTAVVKVDFTNSKLRERLFLTTVTT